MELQRTASGALVLNDAYNANPTSVLAALEALAALPGAGRRIAVLGPMAELGDDAPQRHRFVGERVHALGLELVTIGTPDYGRTPCVDHEAVVERLGPLVAHDAVLVKGSRVAGLEKLAARLLAG
jgi:UDP-N-acetylmuramoyl-tripeptide--D-alanyl-D-alanine ligase